jgi:hypothetical protein
VLFDVRVRRKKKMSDFKDCNDCDHGPGDCLFCSDVAKNMFSPKTKETCPNGSYFIEEEKGCFENLRQKDRQVLPCPRNKVRAPPVKGFIKGKKNNRGSPE